LPGVVNEITQLIVKNDAEVIGFNATVNDASVYIPSFVVSDKT